MYACSSAPQPTREQVPGAGAPPLPSTARGQARGQARITSCLDSCRSLLTNHLALLPACHTTLNCFSETWVLSRHFLSESFQWPHSDFSDIARVNPTFSANAITQHLPSGCIPFGPKVGVFFRCSVPSLGCLDPTHHPAPSRETLPVLQHQLRCSL